MFARELHHIGDGVEADGTLLRLLLSRSEQSRSCFGIAFAVLLVHVSTTEVNKYVYMCIYATWVSCQLNRAHARTGIRELIHTCIHMQYAGLYGQGSHAYRNDSVNADTYATFVLISFIYSMTLYGSYEKACGAVGCTYDYFPACILLHTLPALSGILTASTLLYSQLSNKTESAPDWTLTDVLHAHVQLPAKQRSSHVIGHCAAGRANVWLHWT